MISSSIKRIQIFRASSPPSAPYSSYSSNDEEDEEDDDNEIFNSEEEEEEEKDEKEMPATRSTHIAFAFGLACLLAGNYFEAELARVKQLPAGIYPLSKRHFNGYMMCEVMYGPLMPTTAETAAPTRTAKKMHQDDYFQTLNIDNPYLKLVKLAQDRYQFKVVLVGDANIEIHTY